MSITVKAPFDLQATLATMKSAKEKDGLMNIWDRDIKAVEDAIETIEAIRRINAFLIGKEIQTVKDLIEDWGWEYALKANRDDVIALAQKLEMNKLADDLTI